MNRSRILSLVVHEVHSGRLYSGPRVERRLKARGVGGLGVCRGRSPENLLDQEVLCQLSHINI